MKIQSEAFFPTERKQIRVPFESAPTGKATLKKGNRTYERGWKHLSDTVHRFIIHDFP